MSTDQQLALARATRGESSHLSKAAQKVVPPFLQKLYEIVNDPKNDELIRWSESGDSFYVLNHERFAREVLGRWFKHQKFTSFVRQLNMYGFRKIPHLQQGVLKSETDAEPWHFEHSHFHRGQPDLLCLIQRKKQPAHGATAEDLLDINDSSQPAAPLSNLTPGQMLDINSVMNGIAAIKRHQQAISADLNELKSSNQYLWQEALAARERHKKHQDTINRILKFLAGVFGNSADAVKHEGSNTASPGIPRKRQRLMIENGIIPEKRKASVVEEVEDDDDDHQSVRSDGGNGGDSVNHARLYASIETPESVQSPRSPSVAASDVFGPTITDITSSFRPSAGLTVRPSDILSRSSSDVSSPAATSVKHRADDIPSSLMPISTAQPPPANNADWSATLQNLINSPVQFQRLMQALAAQQNQPIPTLPLSDPNFADTPALDPRLVTHQVAHYDPNTYDLSRFRTDLPPPTASTPNSALGPSILGPLIPKEDDGPSLEPLIENANRLQKSYHDASEIDADVDALQLSLNSLIHNLGIDPNAVATSSVPTPHETETPMQVDASNFASPGGLGTDPTADFDFDAFLNELSSKHTSDPFIDVTGRFDPSASLDGGTTLGDASTDQLTAFLDDVSSDTGSLHDPLEHQPKTGTKRKSEGAELPPPLVSTEPSMQSPKVKRKR